LGPLVLKPEFDLFGFKPKLPAHLTPLVVVWMRAFFEESSFEQ
jgi:hypothetical protein